MDLQDLVSLRSRGQMVHCVLSEFSSSEHSLHVNSCISRVINSYCELASSAIKTQRKKGNGVCDMIYLTWCWATTVITIYLTSQHTFIIVGNSMRWYFTRALCNNLCAGWLGVTAIEHEITMLIKYSLSFVCCYLSPWCSVPFKGSVFAVASKLKISQQEYEVSRGTKTDSLGFEVGK